VLCSICGRVCGLTSRMYAYSYQRLTAERRSTYRLVTTGLNSISVLVDDRCPPARAPQLKRCENPMGNIRPLVAILLLIVMGFVLVVSHETGQAVASNGVVVFDSLDQVSTSTTSTVTTTTTSTSTSLTSTTQTTSTSFTFTVPSLSLNPNFGYVGLTVQVTGSGYSTTDTSCSISGTVVASPTCSVSGGALNGSFAVANVGVGSYGVTATGNQVGDSASTSFTVNSGPSITFDPSSASPATTVHVSGSGFLSTDTSCSLSGTPISQGTCSVTGGTLDGAFTVANVASGFYTITATANPGGDSASANFQVNSAIPTITVNPSTAGVGATVQVSGSGFAPSDSSCSLSGGGVVASETCSVSNGAVSASFVVAAASAGSFTINVTGNPAGDSASALFTLSVSAASMSLNPTGGAPGGSIQVSGTEFSLADTSCTISGTAVTSPNCSISGGTVSGSFTVANVGAGYYTTTVTGSTGDSASANLAVGPTMAPAIPGFPVEAILSGLFLGLATIALLRRRGATA